MLILIVAVLCFLAGLTALCAVAAERSAAGWRRDLAASVTVQVRPKAGETPSEAADAATEALAAVRGVSEARALDREAAEKLLEPWLGKGNLPDDLPIPRLVVVDLDKAAPASVPALEAALKGAGLDADVDDHGLWLKEVRSAGRIVLLSALAVLALFGVLAAAVIAFATRATLQARREVVEVLHLAGAEDGFLAGLVQRRFGLIAFEAAALGAVCAGVFGGALILFGQRLGFGGVLPIQPLDLLVLLPCPLAAALIAAIAVRGAAMSILRAA